MREAQNIHDVTALMPAYLGFIFYQKSPRYVGDDFVMPVISTALCKTGVFVNEDVDTIHRLVKKYRLDAVQLHGNESVATCETLKSAGIKIIKAFSVDDEFDFTVTRLYEPVVDYFLFDTKGKYYGGNAQSFNWKLLEKYNQRIPFFLSGGISPENVSGVNEVQHMNIHAVDVNSGVEKSPGVKDIQKLNQLLTALNR